MPSHLLSPSLSIPSPCNLFLHPSISPPPLHFPSCAIVNTVQVASVREVSQMEELAARGCTTFTISPGQSPSASFRIAFRHTRVQALGKGYAGSGGDTTLRL